MTGDQIVAVGLLTADNLRVLGDSLKRVYPVDDTPCFSELIQALDEADRKNRDVVRH